MNKIIEIALNLGAENAEKWVVALGDKTVEAWCTKQTVKAAVYILQRNVVLCDVCPRGYHVCGETKDGHLVCFPADWL